MASGYIARSENPIPAEILTPLTGAIRDQIASLGVAHESGRSRWNFSYQYVRGSESVGSSALLAGEYDDSRLSVTGHWLNLSWQL